MRTKALSSSVSAFSRLLASVCLRYGVAKPSVWPCRRACKQRQFSDFRSDSPLDFSLFWFQFGYVRENLRVWVFLVVESSTCCVCAWSVQPWTTDSWSFICLAARLPCVILRCRPCANRRTLGWLLCAGLPH